MPNRRRGNGTAWLADYHNRDGIKDVPSRRSPDENYRTREPFAKFEPVLADHRVSSIQDREETEWMGEMRRKPLDWLRSRLLECSKSDEEFEVLLQWADRFVHVTDVAQFCGCNKSTITREIQEHLQHYRDVWLTNPDRPES